MNLVGGNDELVFDGSSFVADASGRVVLRLSGARSATVARADLRQLILGLQVLLNGASHARTGQEEGGETRDGEGAQDRQEAVDEPPTDPPVGRLGQQLLRGSAGDRPADQPQEELESGVRM